ncbi:MAG: cytochrome P460 family protein [Alphaproteobacteria bacterium]|nr:cytochrome P460 family protein [Alphaproteobacteria bacterium]
MPGSAGLWIIVVVTAFAAAPAVSQASERGPARAIPIDQRAEISGDPAKPRRHFRVPNAARLSPQDASRIYQDFRSDLADGYALSNHPVAQAYRRWRRFNRSPYLSATHGRRHLNNYANPLAGGYGRLQPGNALPEGAIIAKDSFAVTATGDVYAGPLFIMEKMPAGFNYVSGDWRYTMIMPDGSIYGITKGTHAERVEYCIACHLAREDTDHLYFVPEAHRATD